jgi:hypothetical protein
MKIHKKLIVNIVGMLIEISVVLVEIAVDYEVSEIKGFPWKEILQNKLFWILAILLIAYNLFEYIISNNDKKIDLLVEKKVRKKGTTRLFNKIVKDTCQNKFDDANEALEILKNLKEVTKDD